MGKMFLVAWLILLVATCGGKGDDFVTPAGSMVQVKLTCEVDECDKVKADTLLAVQFLTNVILFKEPIKLHIIYEPCQSLVCNNRALAYCLLNYTSPLTTDSGEEHMFPSALAKQLGLNFTPPPFDATIVINSNQYSLYPSNVMEWHSRHHISFLLTFNHEVIHALGLSSAYKPRLSSLPCPELLPNPTRNITLGKFYDYPFDHHVHISQHRTLAHFTRTLNDISSLTYSQYTDTTALSHSPEYTQLQALNALLTTSTPNMPIYFNASNKIIQLDTSLSPFKSGSSLVHLLNPPRRDALLTRSSRHSHFEVLLLNNPDWAQSPYGPQTLAILETLGYSINPNPNLTLSMTFFYKSHLRRPS
ncbi:hypothetical protein DSO57_1002489 [Entomophthora muscae]|uniref:Uncharacterized protein n=1 Tax=Entomophthora muscae TaxID=34485 RepID=A0ACC2SLA5_9FUNG|nr:hypothetical protein DSO57_1002489 [Entomophthora muscae]